MLQRGGFYDSFLHWRKVGNVVTLLGSWVVIRTSFRINLINYKFDLFLSLKHWNLWQFLSFPLSGRPKRNSLNLLIILLRRSLKLLNFQHNRTLAFSWLRGWNFSGRGLEGRHLKDFELGLVGKFSSREAVFLNFGHLVEGEHDIHLWFERLKNVVRVSSHVYFKLIYFCSSLS